MSKRAAEYFTEHGTAPSAGAEVNLTLGPNQGGWAGGWLAGGLASYCLNVH